MPKASKFSPDEGITIYDLKDSEAVHYGEQSKGYVGKNLLPNTAVNATIQQVLFTINSDKSVEINGTNSGNENVFEVGHVSLKAGKYIVTGTGFGSNNLAIQITDYPVTRQLYRIYSGDTEITLENDTTICYRIVISASQAYSNFVVYPMIRLASISDNTYEPNLTPNTEIDNKVSWTDNTILGAKNFFDIYNPVSVNGTLSKITNGISIVANSAVNYGNARYYINFPKNTDMRIRCDTEDIANGVNMIQVKGSNDNITFTTITQLTGNTSYDTTFNTGNYEYYTVQLFFTGGSGAIGDGVKYTNFMIWLNSDTDTTLHSYTKTNSELTEEITRIPLILTPSTDITIENVGRAYYSEKGKIYLHLRFSSAENKNAFDSLAIINNIPQNVHTKTTLSFNLYGVDLTDGSTKIFQVYYNGAGSIAISSRNAIVLGHVIVCDGIVDLYQ